MLLDLEIGMGGGFRFGGTKRDLIGVDTMFICVVGLLQYLNLSSENNKWINYKSGKRSFFSSY